MTEVTQVVCVPYFQVSKIIFLFGVFCLVFNFLLRCDCSSYSCKQLGAVQAHPDLCSVAEEESCSLYLGTRRGFQASILNP